MPSQIFICINITEMGQRKENKMSLFDSENFSLRVTLAGNRLRIIFKDFKKLVGYQQEYSQDSINSINKTDKKISIESIYNVFNSANKLGLPIYGSDQAFCRRSYIYYFKISQGGKMTIYENILDQITNKQVQSQFVLQLGNMRDLTQSDVFQKRISDSVKSLQYKLKNNVNDLQSKLSSSEEKVKKNQGQITKLKKEQFMWHLFYLTALFLVFFLMLAKSGTISNLDDKIAGLGIKFQQIQASILRADMKSSEIVSLVTFSNRPNTTATPSTNIFQHQYLHFFPQANLNSFHIQGPKVTYTAGDKTWRQYIFNYPLQHSQVSTFKFLITSTASKVMTIGVTDYNLLKNQQSSFLKTETCYFGYGRRCKGGQEGKGFKTGDVVEVFVDRVGGTVKFEVNGSLEAIIGSKGLQEAGKVYMPFVEMRDAGDAVQWLI